MLPRFHGIDLLLNSYRVIHRTFNDIESVLLISTQIIFVSWLPMQLLILGCWLHNEFCKWARFIRHSLFFTVLLQPYVDHPLYIVKYSCIWYACHQCWIFEDFGSEPLQSRQIMHVYLHNSWLTRLYAFVHCTLYIVLCCVVWQTKEVRSRAFIGWHCS